MPTDIIRPTGRPLLSYTVEHIPPQKVHNRSNHTHNYTINNSLAASYTTLKIYFDRKLIYCIKLILQTYVNMYTTGIFHTCSKYRLFIKYAQN